MILYKYSSTCKTKEGEKMGYKIKEAREQLQMSQEKLAQKSGVSRTIISGLESGTITTTIRKKNK